MCVICYKPVESKMPSMGKIEDMWYTNPDGAGVMWIDRETGKVMYEKGFMTLDSLKSFITNNMQVLDATEVALHFRIATHGGINQKNTHPFMIGDPVDQAADGLSGTADIMLMHNGILPVRPRSQDISDSAELAIRAGESGDPISYLESIDEFVSPSKIIVFCSGVDDCSSFIIGDNFKTGDDGLLYSNLNHEYSFYSYSPGKGYSYAPYAGKQKYTGSYYQDDEVGYDEYDDDYYDPYDHYGNITAIEDADGNTSYVDVINEKGEYDFGNMTLHLFDETQKYLERRDKARKNSIRNKMVSVACHGKNDSLDTRVDEKNSGNEVSKQAAVKVFIQS